jgi:predicted amidohydrolase
MRLLLGELAPVPRGVPENLAKIERAVQAAPADLAIFPELFLTGYQIGDHFHRLAVANAAPELTQLQAIARSARTALLLGAPLRSEQRAGEVENAALLVRPDGSVDRQVKRFLPTYGPFDEGRIFTPTERGAPLALGDRKIGVEICYDAFFPEVTRALALAGAELLVDISASPVTSKRLFEKVLPARAVENAAWMVYVNRVGVEDGIVFGGGSGVWDPRGEPVAARAVEFPGGLAEERLFQVEVDLAEGSRWRPFRPVLRDVAARPGN